MTKAYVCIKVGDKYRCIYCHARAHPRRMLPILTDHYNTEEKVMQLIKHGAASYIAPEIGEKNDWENPDDNVCLFMYRDGNSLPWKLAKPKEFSSKSELMREADILGFKYVYIFENGEWQCQYVEPYRYIS